MNTHWGELEDEYYVIENESVSFVDGAPSWFITDTKGGGSVTFEQNNMGSAVLSTGDGGVGDYAEIKSNATFKFDHPINKYSALGIEVIWELKGNAQNDGDAIVFVGFNSGGRKLLHTINHTDAAKQSTFLSGNTRTDTKTFLGNVGASSTQLFGDFERGKSYHRDNEFLVAELEDQPFGGTDLEIDCYVETQNTSDDCKLVIHGINIAYFGSLRR